MHKTDAGEKRKALQKEALELAGEAKAAMKAAKTLPEAGEKARELEGHADKALAESEALKPVARLEDTNVWVMEKVKITKKGSRSYRYWMANWREDGKVRNVHLGSCGKMDEETARQKARELKAVALCMSERVIQRVSELER
jgi:hypothetical protein